MTGFRASAAVFAALIVLGGTAAAQAPTGGPVPLGPAVRPPPTQVPAPPPRAAPSRSDLPVQVDRLSAVDPDSVGLLGDGDGGLGVDLWRGTSRALAANLIQSLPAPLESAAMRALARRLLLTTATAPNGKPADGPLLLARARKLTELGIPSASVDLVRAAPAAAMDERLAQVEVEGLFFGNDNSGACARVRGIDDKELYWQQALAFCLALAGEGEKAAMIADLLRERGSEAPPSFFALMEAIGGDKNVKVEPSGEPSALALSMMRVANRKLPDPVARSERAAVLRVVALSPNAELGTRLMAAERAEALGAITAGELAEIDAAVPFTPEEMSNATSVAEAQWGPRGRALLLRAALAQNAPVARIPILARAFALGREKSEIAAVRRVMAPSLSGIEPSQDTLSVAADAGATLYALGRVKDAGAWYDAVEQAAPGNPDAARAWTTLWPLSMLAAKPATWDPSIVLRWRNAQAGTGKDDAARVRAATLFALFDALGQNVPAEGWAGLLRDARPVEASLPDPAVWYALDNAARERRRGETVALALLAIGPRGPGAANPLTLSSVIVALVRAGLESDARALALEAAVAQGG